MKELEILRQWFRLHKRDFPWREDRTPYRVWISEIMLQQTRASVVIDYFNQWIKRFPTIEDLAKASEQQVLKLWEGLGYYSRARAIHSSAKLLVENHQGQLPSSFEGLLKIKGIGPYTAGAIASFAFNKKAVALDGNVMRVWTRLLGETGDIVLQKTKRALSQSIYSILPNDQPEEIMEGLIELGATLCGKKPNCRVCPLKSCCYAYNYYSTHKLPVKSKTYKIKPIVRLVACVYYKNRLLVKKNEKGKIMADLWEFPYFEESGLELYEQLTAIGVKNPIFVKRLDRVLHHFTSYKATLLPSIWKVNSISKIDEYHWVEEMQLSSHPFSSGHKKILDKLNYEKSHCPCI